MNCQSAHLRRKRAGWITLDIDIPKIVDSYAKRFVTEYSAHETREAYARQAALDMRMPEFRRWVLDAIRKLENQGATV